MFIAFFSTSDVFLGEEKLNNNEIDCKVVPTPVTDKAYCGVCLECDDDKALLVLDGLEYEVVGV